jgi:flagellar motor protein MotB
VVGHASSRTRNMDPDRHRSVNYQISVERASSVARELTKLGVPSEMIVVSAMADEEPVYREVMPSGETGNRRAEIYIDY